MTNLGKNSSEWNKQNRRSTRNFIRKWGKLVEHDKYLNPIVSHKRDIGIVIENPSLNIIGELEPYCNSILLKYKAEAFEEAYLEVEQPNTLLKLKSKFKTEKLSNDIVINFKGETIEDLKEIVYFLNNIDYIIKDHDSLERPTFNIEIKNKDNYFEKENIYLNNEEKYDKKYSNAKIKIY